MSLTPTHRSRDTVTPAPATYADPDLRRWGLVMLVGGVVAAGLVYALAVLTAPGQQVDNALLDRIAVPVAERYAWRQWLVNPYLLLAASGVVALLGLVRGVRACLSVIVAVSLLTVATQVLKPLLPRPDLADPWVMANSLPSGHTGAAAALAIALILVLPRLLLPLGVLVGVAVTTYMGAMVVLLGFHRPSDVVVSVLLAVAALGVGLLVRGPVGRPGVR